MLHQTIKYLILDLAFLAIPMFITDGVRALTIAPGITSPIHRSTITTPNPIINFDYPCQDDYGPGNSWSGINILVNGLVAYTENVPYVAPEPAENCGSSSLDMSTVANELVCGANTISITSNSANAFNAQPSMIDKFASLLGYGAVHAAGLPTISVTLDCQPEPDLVISKSLLATPFPGQTLSYTINITNSITATGSADTIYITEMPGNGLDLSSANFGTPSTGTMSGSEWQGLLAPAESMNISYNIDVDSNYCGPISNTVSATEPDEPTSLTSDNSALLNSPAIPCYDLELTNLEIVPDNQTDSATLTLQAANNGEAQTTNTYVGITFDQELVLADSSHPNCTLTGMTVTCPLGTLALGQQESIWIRFTGPVTQSAVLGASAYIRSDQSETTLENNSTLGETSTTPGLAATGDSPANTPYIGVSITAGAFGLLLTSKKSRRYTLYK